MPMLASIFPTSTTSSPHPASNHQTLSSAKVDRRQDALEGVTSGARSGAINVAIVVDVTRLAFAKNRAVILNWSSLLTILIRAILRLRRMWTEMQIAQPLSLFCLPTTSALFRGHPPGKDEHYPLVHHAISKATPVAHAPVRTGTTFDDIAMRMTLLATIQAAFLLLIHNSRTNSRNSEKVTHG